MAKKKSPKKKVTKNTKTGVKRIVTTKSDFVEMSKEENQKFRTAIIKGDYVSLGVPKKAKNIKIYRDKLGDLIIEYEE